MRPKLVILYSAAVVFIIIAAGAFFKQATNVSPKEDDYCSRQADCSCGKHIETGECFIGNKKHIQQSSDCFDFCFQGQGLEIKCVDHRCRRVYSGQN